MTQKQIMEQLKKSNNETYEFIKNSNTVTQSEEGERKFEGWLSTYGNIDSDGDIFEKGAFSEAIKNRDTYPLLINHNTYDFDMYVGEFKAFDKPEGVWIEAEIYEDIPHADKLYKMLKSGALQEMSIGFRIEDYKNDLEMVEDEDRPWGYGFNFKKSLIREGSVVLAPANLNATIESVKNQNNTIIQKFEVGAEQLDEISKVVKDTIDEHMNSNYSEILENDKSVIDSKLDDKSEEDESITKKQLLDTLDRVSELMKGK